MKFLSKLFAVALILGLAGVVSAKDAAPATADQPAKEKKDKAVSGSKGKVVKASEKELVIKTGGKEGKEVTYTVDDKTKVTIDGKDGKITDLKEGQQVSVTPSSGTALTVEVKAAKPAKEGKGGDKPAEKTEKTAEKAAK